MSIIVFNQNSEQDDLLKILGKKMLLLNGDDIFVYVWTTRCPYCPAKLSKIDTLSRFKSFQLVTVLLEVDSLFDSDVLQKSFDIVEEMQFSPTTQTFFMCKDEREAFKAKYKFNAVPRIFKYDKTARDLVPCSFEKIVAT